MNTKTLTLLAISSAVAFGSCKKKGCTDETATNYSEEAKKDDGSCEYSILVQNKELISQVKANYANIVYQSYLDAYNKAGDLKTAIIAFVDNPSQNGLDNAKQAWLDAREPYGQTEVYRFANGPIDAEDGPEGLLNAWPLDEGYVDYIAGNATSGIINDVAGYPTLSASVLEAANEAGAAENVSIGYHAIEFLLWGQDDANTALQTAGQRPYTDYVTGGAGTASNQDRRGQYLKICATLLVDHLELMVNDWNPNGGSNYYSTFMGLSDAKVVTNIITGMATLSKSELAGERVFVALQNQNQEDEHSCFADNTHRDIITNADGIRNVYTGSYTKVDGSVVSGKGIKDLITAVNTSIAGELNTLFSDVNSAVNAIPVPFDHGLTQESVGGTGPIMTSVTKLQAQGDKLVEAGAAIGISISTALPE
ncbi:MAG: hypothetical protein N4A35_07660 [Flavobacteriales bacterium]|jgi:putative iron-regulated protein|nr:hypothetical protein [Flavobacteriales bacterium]